MRLGAIADLHLCGVRGCRECRVEESELLRLLDRLESTHDKILVLGDLFNLDHGPLPLARGAALRAAKARFPKLSARLFEAPYVVVYGNHDAALRHHGIPSMVRMESPMGRVVAAHGHQFDGWIKKVPVIAPVGAWLELQSRRVGVDPLAQGLISLGALAARRGGQGSGRERSLAGAREVLRREGARIFLQGHVHQQYLSRVPEGVVINPGQTSFGVQQYASLDLSRGALRLWRKREEWVLRLEEDLGEWAG